MSRSVGIKRDLRLSNKNSYSGYSDFELKSYCGVNGDSYDRFLIRMLEMGESLSIVTSVATKLLSNFFLNSNNYVYSNLFLNKMFYQKQSNNYSSMEDLISHFLF